MHSKDTMSAGGLTQKGGIGELGPVFGLDELVLIAQVPDRPRIALPKEAL